MKIETKIKIIDKALWFLIKLEERLVDVFSPHLEPEEVTQYRDTIKRHKREMKEELQYGHSKND